MRRTLAAALVAATLSAASPVAAGDGGLVGTWADGRRENVCRFTRDGRFVHYRKVSEVAPLPGETATGRPIVTWARTEGTYRSGRKICGLGKRPRGNLHVFADGFEGCMQQRIEGTRLVLTEVYTRGAGAPGFPYERVMERSYDLPRGIPED